MPLKLLPLFILMIVPLKIAAQLKGNNMYEFQLGNVPNDKPADLTTHYNMLNLLYTYKNISGSVRYEQFLHPDQNKEYYQISQYSLTYREKGLSIKIGNFYETLGNGILLRSYEIPSSIFEDQAYRVRQGFYRDLKGFNASYVHRLFNIKLVRGRSLFNLIPPGFDDELRRPDLTEAIEMETNFFSRKVGFILLRNTNDGSSTSYASLFSSGTIIGNISYSVEMAKRINEEDTPWFSESSGYGFYSSLNYSVGNLGISLEYKDYQNIFIGAGISDPPTLVREQNYKVLNRSTHVPELSEESGYQAEVFYSFPKGDFLTLNHSRSINELGKKYIFQEYFVEYQKALSNGNALKFFIDYSSEPLRLEFDRYSGGFSYEPIFSNNSGGLFQIEYQHFKREDFLNASIDNAVAIIGWHNSKQLNISLTYELSTDPIQTDLSSTFEIERGKRHWIGINSSFRLNDSNKLYLFAGQRRGGPACTSGICYEILDFEGVEIRLTSKF